MRIFYVFAFLLIFSCKDNSKQVKGNPESSLKPSALIEVFKYQPDHTPWISVHRGGVGLLNYPENCLETIKYVNDSIAAVFEIDIAKTKDGVLVLLHDNTLERTTTGTGKLTQYTYDELLAFNMKDDFGNVTNFKIPKFSDVLSWSKANQAILTVDIKRSVDVADVIQEIRDAQAEDIALIITYDMEQANKAYNLAPDLLLSVSARNQEELDWLLESNIPTQNMLAFTGTRLSDKSLYTNLHENGIKTMLGTLGNLDKQAEAKGDGLYMKWRKLGIDIFATDRPFEAAKALNIEK
ncbi:glycerophosphodiester phosphodiesterase family protein [Bizionia argentinensis JUB59]|uniref:Glycerophosphodiester phosphodiesterase family protein n=1 Tax=Bizionia argentinensis JUB59 TaxID=1046627 RepID=G2EBX9_9FLAO|nr:glycerophosphodiester phosphodiesterase family protein [Bizionia argentinensis]EGV44042.1 glycerophosphodiester phosphodiesterase family protein [Bizionia argentinensis JUB59]